MSRLTDFFIADTQQLKEIVLPELGPQLSAVYATSVDMFELATLKEVIVGAEAEPVVHATIFDMFEPDRLQETFVEAEVAAVDISEVINEEPCVESSDGNSWIFELRPDFVQSLASLSEQQIKKNAPLWAARYKKLPTDEYILILEKLLNDLSTLAAEALRTNKDMYLFLAL